jgi:hypothetical protein
MHIFCKDGERAKRHHPNRMIFGRLLHDLAAPHIPIDLESSVAGIEVGPSRRIGRAPSLTRRAY